MKIFRLWTLLCMLNTLVPKPSLGLLSHTQADHVDPGQQIRTVDSARATKPNKPKSNDPDAANNDVLFSALIGAPTLLTTGAVGLGVWWLGQSLQGMFWTSVGSAAGLGVATGVLGGLAIGMMVYAVTAMSMMPLLLADPLLGTGAAAEKETDASFWTYVVGLPIASGLGLGLLTGFGAVAVEAGPARPFLWGGLALAAALTAGANVVICLWDPVEDLTESAD